MKYAGYIVFKHRGGCQLNQDFGEALIGVFRFLVCGAAAELWSAAHIL